MQTYFEQKLYGCKFLYCMLVLLIEIIIKKMSVICAQFRLINNVIIELFISLINILIITRDIIIGGQRLDSYCPLVSSSCLALETVLNWRIVKLIYAASVSNSSAKFYHSILIQNKLPSDNSLLWLTRTLFVVCYFFKSLYYERNIIADDPHKHRNWFNNTRVLNSYCHVYECAAVCV